MAHLQSDSNTMAHLPSHSNTVVAHYPATANTMAHLPCDNNTIARLHNNLPYNRYAIWIRAEIPLPVVGQLLCYLDTQRSLFRFSYSTSHKYTLDCFIRWVTCFGYEWSTLVTSGSARSRDRSPIILDRSGHVPEISFHRTTTLSKWSV